MVRSGCSARSALLAVGLFVLSCLGTAQAGPAAPVTGTESQPRKTSEAASKSASDGFRDLICKPNGTEDGFDCAIQSAPARIVPIPSQMPDPRPQDQPVSG